MIAAAISVLFGVSAAVAVWSIADSLTRALNHCRAIRAELEKISQKEED